MLSQSANGNTEEAMRYYLILAMILCLRPVLHAGDFGLGKVSLNFKARA